MSKPPWLPERLIPFWSASERSLLRATIVGEAEGEMPAGMQAVGNVVVNRQWCRLLGLSRLAWFHTDLRVVCLYPHQFSCWWADWQRRRTVIERAFAHPELYPAADAIAAAILEGAEDLTLGSDHYFNPRVAKPVWAESFEKTVRIGGHVFYRSWT